MKIGKRLKHLRESAEYDIEEMAEAMGVKSYTIRRYENDERMPDYDTLIWYAKTFSVTTDYILNYQIEAVPSLEDVPIDYSGWSDPKEQQALYAAGALIRLAPYVNHIKKVVNLFRDLVDQAQEENEEQEEIEDNEENEEQDDGGILEE